MQRRRPKVSLTSNGYDIEDIHGNVRKILAEAADSDEVPELCACVAELVCSPGYGAKAAVQFLAESAVDAGRLSRNAGKHAAFAKRLSMLARAAGARDAVRKPDFQRLLYELCGSILLTRPKRVKGGGRALTGDDVQALILSCRLDARSGWEAALGAETTQLRELRLFGFFVTTRNLGRALQMVAYILNAPPAGRKCGVVDFAPVARAMGLDAGWLALQQKRGHVAWVLWFVLIFSNLNLWSKAERAFVAGSLTVHGHASAGSSNLLTHTMRTLHEKKVVVRAEEEEEEDFSAKDGEWQAPFRHVLGESRQKKDLNYLYTDLA